MKSFDFIGKKKIFFIISAVVLVVGILSIAIRGFNWGTDFKGGTSITLDTGSATVSASEVEALAKEYLQAKEVSVQSYDSGYMITCSSVSAEVVESFFDAMSEQYGINTEDSSYSDISASVSSSLRNSAILSTVIVVILMLVYITIRFELLSGVAAVICLVHDLFVMTAVYSLFQIPMNSKLIAVYLTILGYSINATIVVFDRVRENRKLYPKKSFDENVNNAINQTFTRSLNTTITTLLTIGMIYILGVTSIREFALPLIIGIVSGLYSSVCLSGALWSTFKKK